MNDTHTAWQSLSDQLHRFTRKRVADRDAAADIAQEALVRAVSAFGIVSDPSAVARWGYRTARNLIIDRYRREKPQSTSPVEEAVAPRASGVDESADLSLPPGACATAMLDRLDPAYRQAVTLADAHGLSQQAVADQLGISLSGAKSRVQRGRAKLRGMLLDCCRIDLDRRGNVVTCERTDRSDAYCGN